MTVSVTWEDDLYFSFRMQACDLTFTKEIKEMLSKITKGKALIALYQQLLSVLQKDLHSLPVNIMQKNRKGGHNNSSPCCHFVLTCSSSEAIWCCLCSLCALCLMMFFMYKKDSQVTSAVFKVSLEQNLIVETVHKECIVADNRTWWKGHQVQGCPSRKDSRSGELGFLPGSILHFL